MQRAINYSFTGGSLELTLDVQSSVTEDDSELSGPFESAFASFVATHAGLGAILGSKYSSTAKVRLAHLQNIATIDGLTIAVTIDASGQPAGMCDGAFVEVISKGLTHVWHDIIDAFQPEQQQPSLSDLLNRIANGGSNGLDGMMVGFGPDGSPSSDSSRGGLFGLLTRVRD